MLCFITTLTWWVLALSNLCVTMPSVWQTGQTFVTSQKMFQNQHGPCELKNRCVQIAYHQSLLKMNATAIIVKWVLGLWTMSSVCFSSQNMGKTSPIEQNFGEFVGKARFCHRFSGDFNTFQVYNICWNRLVIHWGLSVAQEFVKLGRGMSLAGAVLCCVQIWQLSFPVMLQITK